MKDEEFDKLLKKQLQEDKEIPKEINQLFSNFEMEVNMKKKEAKIFELKNYLKTASVAAVLMISIFLGGNTYAHINGKETIISPLLRYLGINSNYEENATQFNEQITKEEVTIKMLDGTLDDTSLIVGYEITIENNNPDNWIEIYGDYKINNITINPINSNIDKISDTTYVYYQIFDVNEIKLDNKENIEIEANIYEIKEFTECENLDSVEAVYGKTHTNLWNLTENISLKNLKDSKVYEFLNAKNYELMENVTISVTDFINGSYINILKIKTDKTGYNGDSFEMYYKILDNQNNEIAMYKEEEKQYEHIKYNDRLIIKNINNNSKINIEVYIKMIDDKYLQKVITIPVDLSIATEKVSNETNTKQYKTENYAFLYKDNWNLIKEVDTTRVGPYSVYLGALELEIPSTTNSEYTSSIYVRTIEQNYTLDEYIQQVRNALISSPSEHFEETVSSEIYFKNCKGYQITAETTDGESIYVKQDIFAIKNGKVYVITFFGNEKEFNNLKDNINMFVNNFKIY